MVKKQKLFLAYKGVTSTFDIIFRDCGDLLDILRSKSAFEFLNSSDHPMIGRIDAYYYSPEQEKLFIFIRSNSKNNRRKKILDNNNKEYTGEMSEDKTLTNEYTFVFDFGSCRDNKVYTGKSPSIKKGFLYVYYDGSYAPVRSLLSYFEQDLFKDKIINIANCLTDDRALNRVKNLISKIETDIIISHNGSKKTKIATCIADPKKIFRIKHNQYFSQEGDYDMNSILEVLGETQQYTKELAKSLIDGAKSVTTELITKVHVKGKKRLLIADQGDAGYFVKSFPNEETLGEGGQTIIHNVCNGLLSTNGPYEIKTTDKIKLIEEIFELADKLKELTA